MAVKSSRKTQLGQEVTPGTSVAATAYWRGNVTFEDDRAREFPEEEIGIDGGIGRQYDTTLGAMLTFEDTPLSADQVRYLCAAGIKTVAAAGASPYSWTYPFPYNAAQTIKTFTIEVGDSQQESEAEYCFVESFGIKGSSGGSTAEACMMNASWRGRQWTRSTYTSLATSVLPTPQDLVFTKTKFYIGGVGTAFGSLTQLTSGFLGFDFKYTTGFKPRFYGEGNKYFTVASWQGGTEITCDIQMQYGSTAITEIGNWETSGQGTVTPRKLQILCEGITLGGTVGSYTVHTVDIQMVGSWEKFTGLQDVDEGDTVTGTFRCHYDVTATERGNIVVANTLATLL